MMGILSGPTWQNMPFFANVPAGSGLAARSNASGDKNKFVSKS
jgi:hypothetical protein